MSEIAIAFQLQMIIFLMFVCGYVLRKTNVITPEHRKGLSKLMTTLILPANIIFSFMTQGGMDVLITSMSVLLVAALVQVISYLIGVWAYQKIDDEHRKILRYATIVSNAGFMGNPIMESLYGAQGAVYASVYLLPLRIVMWTAGLSCFTSVKKREAFLTIIKHPCIIATVIGILLVVFPVPIPAFALRTLSEFSKCLLTLSMLIIGSILADVNIRKVFRRSTFYYAGIRLIAIPLLTFGLCRILNMDSIVTATCVLLSGMPAGSTTAILAETYNGNAAYAAECIFITSVISLATIPLLLMLI